MSKNQNRRFRNVSRTACTGLLISLSPLQLALAEGSAQTGLTQPLNDFTQQLNSDATNDASASLYVDILSAGEVINVSLCGTSQASNVSVEIFSPTDDTTPVFTESLNDGNVDCNSPMTDPLTTPMRFQTTEPGTYRLVLETSRRFDRYDVSVTPDMNTDPDPSIAAGRLWAFNYGFLTGSFGEAASTDANYFALLPGGRPNTNYIWMLDLNNFAGNGYDLVANSIGLDAPNSGYSASASGNSVTHEHPLYLGVPAVANGRPVADPNISAVSFLDDIGQDNSITPGATPGEQDTGVFEFTTDVEGTYQIAIDLNQDQIFGNTGDRILIGRTTPGLNSVIWDGMTADQNEPALGDYAVQVRVNTGEFHFIANDVETSGGSEPGLTIFASDQAGNLTDTLVYWDDATLINDSQATSNAPFGALSSTPEARHTWGTFSSNGFGDRRLIDTYVYGLTATAVTELSIQDTDVPPDADGDGLDDVIDLDDDNDGINDVVEGSLTLVDTDNDSIPDFLDLDSDNDGIPDSVEESNAPVLSNNDSDSDGIADEIDVTNTAGQDSNGNGIDDRFDPIDTDGDNIPNHRDLDSDSDGITDQLEAGDAPATPVDTDEDGAADYVDTDSDNDTLPDNVEAAAGIIDTDSDGVPDYRDLDSDNDTIVDATEAGANPASPTDTDADGVPDFKDLDSDNDTILDAVEGNNDVDTDGTPNFRDTDSDGDNIPDSEEASADTDNDGIPNSEDTDSDGDGLPDELEGTVDTDNDGILDVIDLDSDNDTIPDAIELDIDTDSDGVPNYLDNDSDNDGIPDATEAGAANVPVDSDGDSLPDYIDLDSDNDGLTDAVEAITPGLPADTDLDGIANHLDRDSDNDGLTDTFEAGGADTDRDGIIDDFLDADQDGLHDAVLEAALPMGDFDADRIPDVLDLDSDNDGLSDAFETSGAVYESDGNGLLDNFTDENLDGLDDAIALKPLGNIDIDSDGLPNQLDLDTDSDSIADLREVGFIDEDFDQIIDSLRDIDLDGIPDSVDVSFTNGSDEDGDGIDDFADVDFVVMFNDDFDGDGIVDSFDPDANGNGFADAAEGDNAPFELTSSFPDNDSDGIADVQEANRLITGVSGVGGGCTVSGDKLHLDPTLVALLLFSGVAVTRRRVNVKDERKSQ